MTKLLKVLPFLFLLGGCPSSAIKGKLTPIMVESKKSTPLQQCQAAPGFIELADRAMYFVLDEMDKANLIDKSKTIKSMKKESPIICQIQQPEPCMFQPASCKRDPTNKICARKRGCGHAYGMWIAKMWPPVCRDFWPNEPHCINDASKQTDNGFLSDLCKEMCEVVCARNFKRCKSCYHDPQLSAFKKAAKRLQQWKQKHKE